MVKKVLGLLGDFLLANPWFTVKLINYKKSSVRVVYYHMVSEEEVPHYFMRKSITRKVFKEQLEFFKKNYEIVTLQEAIKSIDNDEQRENLLVISFDDGFRENYTEIFPILNQNNIKATFFIITNCLDNKDLMWRNKLLLIGKSEKKLLREAINETVEQFKLPPCENPYSLLSWSLNHWKMADKEHIVNFLWSQTIPYTFQQYLNDNQPYLTSSQIKEMHEAGHEIGSHSVSHPIFSKLGYDEFKDEIFNSSKILSLVINNEVHNFSYPFGRVASRNFEEEYRRTKDKKVKFFGTKNDLNNKKNLRWERDNAEYNHNIMLFRFAVLPIFRNIKKRIG